MIIGVGTDIVDIRRLEALHREFGERMEDKLFTREEREGAREIGEGESHRFYSYFAKRFVAKEACAKALGTGIGRDISFQDVTKINDERGRPMLKLTGAAAKTLARITPRHMTPQINVSLSDDYPFAQAMVVISAVPERWW